MRTRYVKFPRKGTEGAILIMVI
jgi:hypothetical protein